MIDWYLVPLAVLLVLLLFRFTGCGFAPAASVEVDDPYLDAVKKDNPVVYYRLQETGGLPATAADEMNQKIGTYSVAPLPLDDPAYLSQTILMPSIELGVAPSIMPKEPNATAVRFNGADVFALGPLGDLSRFSLEAMVRPEWDLINQPGFFHCVLENGMHLPGHGAPSPLKNAGFAIYAGPDDPSNALLSPYCWQLWVGTGNEFARANPVNGGPGPLVKAENTYLAVTFDDTQAFLYVYTAHANIDSVRYELIRRPYLQAAPPSGEISLSIGIAGRYPALVPPVPGPSGFLYPFVGRMAEVAIYNTVLDPGRIMSHIMSAFNS